MILKDKDVTIDNQDKGQISIGIPNEDIVRAVDISDNKVIYTNTDQTQTIIEPIDGGVRQLIRIENPSAPKTYDFPVELESGDRLELTGSQFSSITNRQTQGARVIDANGQTKLIVAPPWAKDNNNNLNTYYTIENGNTLRQHIDFDDKTAFPIVADPIWCGDTVKSAVWINRNNVWSASITPTWCIAVYSTGSFLWKSWEEAYQKIPNSNIWDKKFNTDSYWSMFNQYACHAYLAKFWKTPWNIEPATPNKEYWGFVRSSTTCN